MMSDVTVGYGSEVGLHVAVASLGQSRRMTSSFTVYHVGVAVAMCSNSSSTPLPWRLKVGDRGRGSKRGALRAVLVLQQKWNSSIE